MKRLALVAVVLVALAGCAPPTAEQVEAERVASALEKLDGVDRAEQGYLGDFDVYLEADTGAAEIAAIVERYNELDWQGGPDARVHIRLRNEGHQSSSFIPAGLDDAVVEHEAQLWLDLVPSLAVVSFWYSDGARAVNGELTDDATLFSTVGLLRDLRGFDFGDRPTSWFFTLYADRGHETAGFEGEALPTEAALAAILTVDSLLDVTEFRIETHGPLHMRVQTPSPDGLDPDDLSAMRGTAVWSKVVEATAALAAAGEPFSMRFDAERVGTYVEATSCAADADAGYPLNAELQSTLSADLCATVPK